MTAIMMVFTLILIFFSHTYEFLNSFIIHPFLELGRNDKRRRRRMIDSNVFSFGRVLQSKDAVFYKIQDRNLKDIMYWGHKFCRNSVSVEQILRWKHVSLFFSKLYLHLPSNSVVFSVNLTTFPRENDIQNCLQNKLYLEGSRDISPLGKVRL